MYYRFKEYVSVEQKRQKAEKIVARLRAQGRAPNPVAAFRGKMAATFWGKSWCENLESYADYENRLDRGRSYVRSGCVCHLEISDGKVEAMVSGSALYVLTVGVKPLGRERWNSVRAGCAGQVGSLLELLQGKISRQVMEIVCDRETGIFPSPAEISFDCSCPDWASMCKHVAATLYGIGRRLDTEPELLFTLRGVRAADLIPANLDFTRSGQDDALAGGDLGELFGIDLEDEARSAPPAAPVPSATAWPPLSGPPAGPGAAPKGRARRAPAARDGAVQEPAAAPLPPSGPVARAPFKPERPTGAAIRRLRKLADMTPDDFARALGITLVTVLRWEKSRGVLGLRDSSKKTIGDFQDKLLSGR